MTPARRIAQTIRQARQEDDRRTVLRSGVRLARVVGRETDGRHRLQYLDGTCVLGGEVGPEGTGDEISIPAGPLYDRGTTGVAGVSLSREAATLYVERLEPSTYYPGESYTVEVIGRGLTEATVFDFLRPGTEAINADVTITDQRWISDTLVELDITVAPGAAVFAAAPLAFDDPTVVA